MSSGSTHAMFCQPDLLLGSPRVSSTSSHSSSISLKFQSLRFYIFLPQGPCTCFPCPSLSSSLHKPVFALPHHSGLSLRITSSWKPPDHLQKVRCLHDRFLQHLTDTPPQRLLPQPKAFDPDTSSEGQDKAHPSPSFLDVLRPREVDELPTFLSNSSPSDLPISECRAPSTHWSSRSTSPPRPGSQKPDESTYLHNEAGG